MAFLKFLSYEVWWYGPLVWLVFVALAFCATRFLGRVGVLVSGLAVAVCLYVLDLNWVLDDMRLHPEHGRDADGVFLIGVLLRGALFNLILLPVNVLGLRLRRRSRHTTRSTVAA